MAYWSILWKTDTFCRTLEAWGNEREREIPNSTICRVLQDLLLQHKDVMSLRILSPLKCHPVYTCVGACVLTSHCDSSPALCMHVCLCVTLPTCVCIRACVLVFPRSVLSDLSSVELLWWLPSDPFCWKIREIAPLLFAWVKERKKWHTRETLHELAHISGPALCGLLLLFKPIYHLCISGISLFHMMCIYGWICIQIDLFTFTDFSAAEVIIQ